MSIEANAPANIVNTTTCNGCDYKCSGRSLREVDKSILDHAQWAHGEFLGAVWRSKPVTVAVPRG